MQIIADTSALLIRTSDAPRIAQIASWEGATHQIVLSDRHVVFYRTNADGATEFATAAREDSIWVLSRWTLRLTHGIPTTARPLRGVR